jgi:DNA mismatch repair protein MutS2
MVVATTHYSELKVFAHSTPGLQNASLDFDPVTLAPTYHLTVGVPGGSNAMAIASQLGLPREIIDAAREMLPKGTQDIESLLETLMDEKRRAEELRHGLEEEEERARRIRSDLETEVRSFQEGKREAIRETRDRVNSEASVLQSAIREAEAELKKQLSKERVEKARRALSHVREQLRGETWQAEAEGLGGDEVIADVRLALGDQVWLTEIEAWATVLSLPDADGQLDVRIGQTRMRLTVDDIGDARPAGEGVRRERMVTTGRLSRPRVSHELDLRGKRAEDVEPELDGYLDSASLAHLGRVRIIHGYGTGTVRQIVRSMLATHLLVKSYRPGGQGEGGDGVTIVEL